jgi:hypothetical protein
MCGGIANSQLKLSMMPVRNQWRFDLGFDDVRSCLLSTMIITPELSDYLDECMLKKKRI